MNDNKSYLSILKEQVDKSIEVLDEGKKKVKKTPEELRQPKTQKFVSKPKQQVPENLVKKNVKPVHNAGRSGEGLKDFANRMKANPQYSAAVERGADIAKAEHMAPKIIPKIIPKAEETVKNIAPEAEKIASRFGTRGKLIAGGAAAVAGGIGAYALMRRRKAAREKMLAPYSR